MGLSASFLLNLALAFRGLSDSKMDSLPTRYEIDGVERVVTEHKKDRHAGYIAVIPIEGVIQSGSGGEITGSMVEDIKLSLRLASEDDDVSAVVLAIDSPGGEVTASDVIYQEVRKLAEKKPVVAVMLSTAASGAYYIACAADYIIANETTFTGSIGVIMHSYNYEGLLEKVGLDSVVFKSGKYKDMLSGTRPATEDEKNYVQGMVSQVYEKFLGIVAESRKLKADDLRSSVADGRILTGKDAVQAGLVDQTGYAEDAYEKARNLSGDFSAGLVRYRPEASFSGLIRHFGVNSQPKLELNLGLEGRFAPKAGIPYYLPEMYTR
jgi:protease-4